MKKHNGWWWPSFDQKSHQARYNKMLKELEATLDLVKDKSKGLREVAVKAKTCGIPVPALNSALDYFDIIRAEETPANLIQGQRDYFGAHTYERRDKEGTFHTEWQDIHNIT